MLVSVGINILCVTYFVVSSITVLHAFIWEDLNVYDKIVTNNL